MTQTLQKGDGSIYQTRGKRGIGKKSKRVKRSTRRTPQGMQPELRTVANASLSLSPRLASSRLFLARASRRFSAMCCLPKHDRVVFRADGGTRPNNECLSNVWTKCLSFPVDAARAKLNAMPLPNPIANIRNVYATRPTVIRNGEDKEERSGCDGGYKCDVYNCGWNVTANFVSYSSLGCAELIQSWDSTGRNKCES